ncbi:hypothetical protein PsYK624_169590 [Phanerochaete sordida]|uniref:Glycosyl transferase family 3 domain-containing protein n=1 Tax=Phanerochaete sordida TaxID=48140 RepID=A0A9P3LPF8_9APHY|nr:hypothetical protein PsYK624_169590 [Phanerochaete sordida]
MLLEAAASRDACVPQRAAASLHRSGPRAHGQRRAGRWPRAANPLAKRGIARPGAGARVIKYGSRASPSSSGPVDLLQSLGCIFTAHTLGTPIPIARVPFTFILGPHYHPALAMIAP